MVLNPLVNKLILHTSSWV